MEGFFRDYFSSLARITVLCNLLDNSIGVEHEEVSVEKLEHLTRERMFKLSVEHNGVGVSKFTGNDYSGSFASLKRLRSVIILGYNQAVLVESAVSEVAPYVGDFFLSMGDLSAF